MTQRHYSPQLHSLESGALYCIWAIVVVIALSILDTYNMVYFVAVGIAKQAVVSSSLFQNCNLIFLTVLPENIVPTLVVVRTGLGHNVHGTNQSNQNRTANPIILAQLTFLRATEGATGSDSTLGLPDIKPKD